MTEIYSGQITGQRDFGIEIYAQSRAAGSTGAYADRRAVIYDTEIATNGSNGGDTDLQRVERNSSGAVIRDVWGRNSNGTPATNGDYGNLANANRRHFEAGALILQTGSAASVNATDGNNDLFIDQDPNDNAGVDSRIVFDVINSRAASFGYQNFQFDFVDLDESAADSQFEIRIEVNNASLGPIAYTLTRSQIDNGIAGDDFGSDADGGVSRTANISIRDFQQFAEGDYIDAIRVRYNNISGAVGSLAISRDPIPFTIPEPSAVLPLLGLLGVGFLRRRR